MKSLPARGSDPGTWFRALLIFGAYYLYFTFADLSVSLEKHRSMLSPPLTAYAIWLAVYLSQFAFACFQLFDTDTRANALVNKKLLLPYLLHQALFAVWLKLTEWELILASAWVYSCVWVLTFVCYVLITNEFRNGDFEGYRARSWLLIEVPFALGLGCETYTLLVTWLSALVTAASNTGFVSPAAELTAFVIAETIVVQAAVLFAGLSILMNPCLHVGLVWGSAWTSYALLSAADGQVIPTAAGVCAGFVAITCFVYLIVALAILCQSQFCLPDEEDDSAAEEEGLAVATAARPAVLQCAIPVPKCL